MIDPTERSVHRFDHRQAGGLCALDHDHLDAETPCCLDLPIGRLTATILGDDDLDLMLSQHVEFVGQSERTSAMDVADIGHRQRRFDGIDAADPVMMLRRGVCLVRLLPARRQENTQRHIAERSYGLRNAMHGEPVIAFDRHPCRTAQGKGGHIALSSRLRGIGRDAGCERMGGIDQQIDRLFTKIPGKPFAAAEATAADRNGLRGRIGRPAGERQDDVEIGARGKGCRQRTRLRRTPQDQNAGLAHG